MKTKYQSPDAEGDIFPLSFGNFSQFVEHRKRGCNISKYTEIQLKSQQKLKPFMCSEKNVILFFQI